MRCNDDCVSEDKPTSGDCRYYARADGVIGLALAPNGDLFAAVGGKPGAVLKITLP